MPQFNRNHIVINERTEVLPYTSNISGRSKIVPRLGLNRQAHGILVRTQFQEAVNLFQSGNSLDFVYLVFKSPVDFFLDLDKFDKNELRLASYKILEVTDTEEQIHQIYEATVYLNPRAIANFLNKIEQYLNEDTATGKPKNLNLISNIEEIRAATLQSFWQEPELDFPDINESVWWEVWLNRDSYESHQLILNQLRELPGIENLTISERNLKFPEHVVVIMRGTVIQLSATILYTDRLAEIRKPRETAEFFTYLDTAEQNQWIDHLIQRTDNNQENSLVSICLLDTGVSIANPLLRPFIPERNLDTVNPIWGVTDSRRWGHGTPMAGLLLFGDLTDAFANDYRVQINYQVESVKLIENRQPHDPNLYGAVTQEAVARAEVINPENKRVVCLAITVDSITHLGRPSSWSSAIDQTIFGSFDHLNSKTLFFVSSGNIQWDERLNFPLSNRDASINDPGQSFNAITVGSYTLKDQIDLARFPDAKPLAIRGQMSPCNTTSFNWLRDWCRKPDIVMEGGNDGIQNGHYIDPDSLKLLSTSPGGIGQPWLTTFGDTSGSTALACQFAGELYHHYTDYWPETIRGLVIHSSEWTPAMLNNRAINQLTANEKAMLFSHVGYGVPNMEKAKYSANNSLSLIAQRILQPFKIENSNIKTNSFHLFDLPWPKDVLQELYQENVQFKITLSYFIEPNPGNKQYDLAASYRSHGLRFKMIDSNESIDAFKARVSATQRHEDYLPEGGENWILGSQLRDKGSIHKDIWEGSAIELSTRNKIAIYPVGGWWKTRKKHERYDYNIRYSLIMTIETPDIDTDIYTPVEAIINLPINIDL